MTDVNATLQILDTGTSLTRALETDDWKTTRTGNATQTTLAAVLAKLSADPATQTTLAAVLAKLSSDPATQTTLAAVLAKLSADPATGAKQDTQAGKLDTLIAKDYATQTTLAAVLAKIIAAPATEAKQDTLATAVGLLAKLTDTQPVSAASLPLPTGAAQEHATAASPHSARLTDGTTYLGSTAQRLHVDDGGSSLSVDDNGGSLTVDGTFWQATQPVSGPLTDTQLRATAVPHDQTKLNGTTVDTNSGNKSAGTQRVVLATDQPALTTPLPVDSSRPATGTLANVASSATSVTVLASNASRKGATIVNESTAILYLKFGTTASATSYTVAIPAQVSGQIPSFYVLDAPCYTGKIDGIWASANGNARVTENT